MIQIQRPFTSVLVVSLCFLALAQANAWATGDAGCGLGSMIIDKNTKISQTLALTTNNTLLTNFFGITSGTSNCSATQLAQNDIEAEKYAEANYQNLRVEMARGEGENLAAFGQLLGCPNSVLPSFGSMTRTHFSEIYPEASVTPVQMILSVRSQMAKENALARGCAQQI